MYQQKAAIVQMDFKVLEEKYNLDFNKLAQILKKQHIILKLEHLNDIPIEWIPIIESSLGLMSPNKSIEKPKEKKQINNRIQNLQEFKRKQKEDQKLSDPQIAKDKIDLSPFKKPKKKNKILKSNSKTIKSTDNGFYAYVKYVGPEFDHAFIKRIDDINGIASLDLRARDDSDFTIKEDCTSLQREQIILCEVKSNKFHLAKIITDTFEGTISKVRHSSQFIDWFSFNSPIVINNIRTFGFDDDETFAATTLHFIGSRLRCKKIELKVNNKEIISKMENIILPIISKSAIKENEVQFIEFYKSNVDSSSYNSYISEQFEKDLNKDQNFSNESNFLEFFNKWRILQVENLVLSNIRHTEHLNMYVKLWLKKRINRNFWENHLIDALINYELKTYENSESNQLSFHDKLIGAHIEEISLAIDIYFQDDLVTDSIQVFNILEQLIEVSNCSNKAAYKTQLKNSLAPELAFDLWLQDDQIQFPKEMAIAKFSNLENEIQYKIIDLINDNELKNLIPELKEITKVEHKKRLNRIFNEQIVIVFNPLSFDLESDPKKIFEIAWNENNDWNFYNDSDSIDKGINLFKNNMSKNNNVVVGHNIVSFDLPILENHNIKVDKERIWDTIQIESFLSPEFNNLALATSHSAKEDAHLTLNLFFNQVLRILKSPKEELTYLFQYLPKHLTEKIEKCKTQIPIKFLDITLLKEEAKSFYRPQAKPHPILKKLEKVLTDSNKEKTIIIGDQSLRLEVSKVLNIQFFNEVQNEIQYALIDVEKIDNSELSNWLINILKCYINYTKTNNLSPIYGNLAPYIQNKISEEINDLSVLLKSEDANILKNKNKLFVSINDLLLHYEDLNKLDDIEVIILQPEFLATSNKIKLEELDLEMLTAASHNINHLWMKFSGGQSYVQLSKEECVALNIDCVPILTNFWIEKYKYAKYIVWGNYNWEKLIKEMSPKKVTNIELNEEFKDHTYFTKINATASYSNDSIRFNPESIYRSRYWVYQKELINQITSNNNPSILLVERKDEIEVLENYFKELGYFVPDNTINMGRRLEFIHMNSMKNKIIIDHISNLNKILSSNYLGALNIIIDSFNLADKYYMAQETSYFKKLFKSQQKELNNDNKKQAIEDEDFNTPKKPLLKDTFFLLKLLKPIISNYRATIHNYNSEHQLWLLDSRIDDYPNLGKLWNIKSRSLNVWHSKEAYEEDLQVADVCIPGVKPLENLPFSIEETKAILSNVFINGGKWHDYQEPYLDLIIPGKTDLLVTLPTGGGKSLLFQAPALFKSAFTNRLSIVVTPLKALMEDQVDKLWQNGFYGSVEYLNSDRSTDTQIIYRAMAGGEIALLFVTPERFRSRSFKNALEVRMQSDGGLEYIIFDEAHCVSQWGHEFRPDYFNCAKEVQRMKITAQEDIPLLLFSATVSEKIYQDFIQIFND
ncbi:DEAD/DEAH box helicase [Gelidibacter japonicus]|uniref:DEAD/DEAH box helicase n=1 Tax=Gelidibacter japonicus TaxID=1962232 RepID=UPI003A947A3E